MTTIIKNQIVKQLARFTKNLSPSKISLKFLKGEGELRNLELNESFLTDLLELPPFIRLTKATCNKISAKIHWTRLKTDPIRLFLDCVEVEMIMTENVTDSEVDQLNSKQYIPSNQTTREKPSEYGFVEKVVDGMLVTINSVVMAFKTPTFKATFQMSHLSIHSTNPNWQKATLRNTRIKDEAGKEVLTFKQITFGTMRVDADALYKSDKEKESTPSSPLRLITSSAKINIVIKKKVENSSVVSARLHVILDDILWVLTHAQLQAVASFAKSVVQVVEKSKKCEPAPSVASDDSSCSSNTNSATGDGYISSPSNPGQNPTSLFQREDVKETCYLVSTSKIDIHLCDDTPTEESSISGNGQSGGSMQIVVNNLSFEHYPYHLAFTSRVHWASHNEASLTRAHWVQELFKSYKKVMKEDDKKIKRRKSSQKSGTSVSHPEHSNVTQDSRGTGKVAVVTESNAKKRSRMYLYECAFVISCDEFIIMPVSTNEKISAVNTPFLCSDKKSLYLPSDMPALQFDYTLYFYPGQEDAKVPQPNLFCQLNPLHLTMDNVTCIWFNRFMQSIRSGFMWAEELVQVAEPRHIDVRIEGLMPKLTFPCPSDTNAYYKQFRPQALQFHISSFRATNTRVGKDFQQCDLVNTLQAFLQTKLYTENEMFPNDARDANPLPQVNWLNDFSVVSGVETIERFLNNVKEDNIATSVVWMLNACQCWCDFIGVDEANGRPRPFVEPFPLRLCMCYPITTTNHPPCSVKYHAETKSTTEEPPCVLPLHRTPSDPYSKQPRVSGRNNASSTRSTPASPGFARIYKSRSATSVNIPLLASDVQKMEVSITYPSQSSSLSASRSPSEDESCDSCLDDTGSGSAQSIPIRTNVPEVMTEILTSSCNTKTIPNSTSESDCSAEHGYERSNGVLSTTKQEPGCCVSMLLFIPSILAVKLDHYQFVFLMRLQESFVSLRDVLSSDSEKFEVQRNKDKDLVSPRGSQDNGIVVSLVSRGAEVTLLVPAATGEHADAQHEKEPGEESSDVNVGAGSDPCRSSPNVARLSEDSRSESSAVGQTKENNDGDNDYVSNVGTMYTAEVGDWTLVNEQRPGRTSGDPVVRADEPAERSASDNSSSTNGSEFSLQTGDSMASEKSCGAGRTVSTVIIHGYLLECSVAMNDDDFAFKLMASGCELNEVSHENLETFLSQKVKKRSMEIPDESGKCGEISVRYAMGSTVDQSLDGAVEEGVAHLLLNGVIATILMSNLDGVLECVQDEIVFPPPFIPVIIDLKDFNLTINSDTPPRLLSIPPSLPLNLHVDEGTIRRAANGDFEVNVDSMPLVAMSHHLSQDLSENSKEIEKLKVESTNMASRMASVRNQNLRLLKELEISKEGKEAVENERDRLLVTVERLTEELIRSNREQDELQNKLRLSQKT